MIGKLFKLLLFLALFAGVALIVYAYAGPFFGVEFAPGQVETRVPVTLGSE